MKLVGLKETNLDACIDDAQHERIVVTRNGRPVALVVGVEGLDTEQLELGSSAKFWELITERRQQKTLTREQLEQEIRQAKRRLTTTPTGVEADRMKPTRKRSHR